MNILYSIIGVLLAWFMIMLSILFHETGHLSGWKMSTRSKNWHVTAGSGKKLFESKRICLNALPFGGTFLEMEEIVPETKKGIVIMLLGGPVFTLLLTLFLSFIQRFIPADAFRTSFFTARQLVLFVRNYNIVLFLITIIPWKHPKFLSPIAFSDGMSILRVLWNK